MKNYTKGFVRVAGIILLCAVIFSTAFWFAQDQVGKESLKNIASVSMYGGGVYTGPRVITSSIITTTPTPKQKSTEPQPDIKCKVFTSGVDRIDKAKHPFLHATLKGGAGYCGVYGYLLSLYHTFGIREIDTGKEKLPITSNKKDLNLDLVEWYMKTRPGLRNGITGTELEDLYATAGKRCIVVEYDETQVERQCKDLIAYKNKGYDCDLQVYGESVAHNVNIKSVSWSKSKKACVHKVYDTFGQLDPKINPSIHTVTVTPSEPGYYPGVDYPQDNTFDAGAWYTCCK